MVHNTRRKTQPWKSGLPVDFIPAETIRLFPPIGWLMRARRKLFGDYGLLGSYNAHPDRNQENLFFGLLRECVEQGIVTRRCCARRCARTTCATTPSRCWSAPRRSRRERLPACRANPGAPCSLRGERLPGR